MPLQDAVERSEIHHALCGDSMGIAALHPSYEEPPGASSKFGAVRR